MTERTRIEMRMIDSPLLQRQFLKEYSYRAACALEEVGIVLQGKSKHAATRRHCPSGKSCLGEETCWPGCTHGRVEGQEVPKIPMGRDDGLLMGTASTPPEQ